MERCNQPSSLAQFLTRLEGQAITHFWIVDFPASGDCFSKVHMRVMHCSYTCYSKLHIYIWQL